MKILQILFFLILIILPFGELLRFQFDSGFGVTALDVLMIITAIWFVFNSVISKNFPKTDLYKPIGLFVAVCVVSLIVQFYHYSNFELLVSSLYILRFTSYTSIMFVMLSFGFSFSKKIPYLLAFSGIVFVVLGFSQYVFYPSLRNLYYLGWDEHIHRLFGTFLDPNFTGSFLVLFSLFLFGFLFSFKKRKSLLFVLASFILAILLLGVFLTFSRSAYSMLFVGTGTFFFLEKKLKFFAGIIFLFILGILIVSPQFTKENVNLLRITSTLARVENAKEATYIFSQNPILGVGFNSYRYARLQYGFGGESLYPTHSGSGVDNSFLFVLVTTGVIGLSSFIYMWYRIICSIKMNKSSYLSTVAYSSTIALFVNALFINSLFYSFIMVWIFMVIGLSLRSRENT